MLTRSTALLCLAAALAAIPIAILAFADAQRAALGGVALLAGVMLFGLASVAAGQRRTAAQLSTLERAMIASERTTGRALNQHHAALGRTLKEHAKQARQQQDRRFDETLQRIDARHRQGSREIRAHAETVVTEAAAIQNLHALIAVDREMPVPGGFACTPRTLLRLVRLAHEVPPDGLIVECGSGASTVWLAEACRRRGGGRVVALEHDAVYGERTLAALRAAELDHLAEVRIAPLAPTGLAGHPTPWFAADTWADLAGVDLLFVDGPPGSTGRQARLPAVPLLGRALNPRAVVVLDDIDRDDEQQTLAAWRDLEIDGRHLHVVDMLGRAVELRLTDGPPAPPEAN